MGLIEKIRRIVSGRALERVLQQMSIRRKLQLTVGPWLTGMILIAAAVIAASMTIQSRLARLLPKVADIPAVYESLQNLRVMQATAAIGVVGVIVLFIIAGSINAITLSRQISRAIDSLYQAATKLGSGNLKERAESFGTDEIAVTAQAFNAMASRLEALLNSLEQQVADRTRALQTIAEISRQITTILNLDDLLAYVVNRIQQEFGLYHVHIYLLDDKTDDLIMVEGSGQVGKQLKARTHRLQVGEGIVGTVAGTNNYFLSNDVHAVLNFMPNDLLPLTNSELAVPLRLGDRVLGVLDLQSDRRHRWSMDDVSLMQSLADQVAVVIENARLVDKTQIALKQINRLNRRLTRQAWQEFADEADIVGYRFQMGDSIPLQDTTAGWLPSMQEAMRRQQSVQPTDPSRPEAADSTELALPLMLRGQPIGALGLKRAKGATWMPEELEAVETAANQIALALENARLSQEQEKTIVKLKEVDRLKSSFLASMSHELRTPLNSIIGFADILLQGIDGPLSENADIDITAIHNSGKHLLALINDVLDMSKIEAGRMELSRKPLSIVNAFSEVSASVSSLLVNKPVQLVQNIAPDLPFIWADPLRLNQILINLVSNAIKFTDEGTVTLGAERHTADLLYVFVKDTGIGIPKNKFELVFEHFRQVDSRSNRKYQGTGMGLAIARQLVRLHGGDMWLESKLGSGATFFFTVPLAQPTDE